VISTLDDTLRRVASEHCQDVINSYNLTDLGRGSASTEDLSLEKVVAVQGHYVQVIATLRPLLHQIRERRKRIQRSIPVEKTEMNQYYGHHLSAYRGRLCEHH
jgi:hypothetical protein